jgi:tellurite resistance protein TerC
MFHVSAAGWAATLVALAALFGFDLLRSARRPHAVGFRESVVWSVLYIAVALLFGMVFGLVAGWDFGAQYFAGYIVEKSLSVDNLFVFLIIMGTFSVPADQQARALTIGIVAALVMRAIFIAAGAALLNAFAIMFLVFGLVLAATAVQLFRHRNEDPSVDDNVLVSAARRLFPVTTEYHGPKIVVRTRGRRVLTPLFLVLIAIGSTDLLFALDSIPAMFGVTQHAYIDLHLQNHAIPEISTGLSLCVIVVLLAGATAASVIKARKDPTVRAHAGRLRERRDREPSR